MWHGSQQYAGQPMVGITAAGQLQLAAATQSAQGLYNNGYALGTDVGSAAPAAGTKPMAARDAQSASPMYRYEHMCFQSRVVKYPELFEVYPLVPHHFKITTLV